MDKERFKGYSTLPLLFLSLFSLLIVTIRSEGPAYSQSLSGFTGLIRQIDLKKSSLLLDRESGRPLEILFTSRTRIIKDRVDAKVQNLRVGNWARVIVEFRSGVYIALEIDAQTLGPVGSVFGKVEQIDLLAKTLVVRVLGLLGNPLRTVISDESTLIRLEGMPASLEEIQVGDMVQAFGNPDITGLTLNASRLEVSLPRIGKQSNVFGIVEKIQGSYVLVRNWLGVEIPVYIDPLYPPQLVRYNNKRVNPADLIKTLKKGDEVNIRVFWNEKEQLVGLVWFGNSADTIIEGVVAGVQVGEGIITLTTRRGVAILLQVLPSTVIEINGQPGDLAQIRVGDTLRGTAIINTGAPWDVTSLEISQGPVS